MTFTGTDGKQYQLKQGLTPEFWSSFYSRVNAIISEPSRRKEFRRSMDKLYRWLNTYSSKIYAFHPKAQELRKALEEFKNNRVGSRAGNTLRFAARNLTAGVSAVVGSEVVSSKGSDINKISKAQKKILTAAKPVLRAVAAVGGSMIGVNATRGAGFGNMFAPAENNTNSTSGGGFDGNILLIAGGVLLLFVWLKKS